MFLYMIIVTNKMSFSIDPVILLIHLPIRTDKNNNITSFRWMINEDDYQLIKKYDINLIKYFVPLLESLVTPLIAYYINTQSEDYTENILDFIRKKGLRHEVIYSELKDTYSIYNLHILNFNHDKAYINQSIDNLINVRDNLIGIKKKLVNILYNQTNKKTTVKEKQGTIEDSYAIIEKIKKNTNIEIYDENEIITV